MTATDPERLAAVRASGLMDSPPEEAFDRVTRLAHRILGADVGLVSVVDDRRQYFKSMLGLEGWAAEDRGTPLSHSFCFHVVDSNAPLVVPASRRHPLVGDNPSIEDLGVESYLGVPVHDPDGVPLASLCVIGATEREWTQDDVAVLEDLAAILDTELALRRTTASLQLALEQEVEAANQREAISELRMQGLIEGASDAVWTQVNDPEPRLIHVNKAVADLTGWTAEQLLTTDAPFDEIISDEDRTRLQAAVAEGDGEPIDIRIHRRDGAVRWASVAVTVIPDSDGNPWLGQGIARDVDRQHRATAALQQALLEEESAAARAARMQAMISTFLTAISHELRTPLTVIAGTIQVLRARHRQLDAERMEALLTQVGEQAKHLQSMLLDLIDVKQLVEEELTTEHGSASLRAATAGALATLDSDVDVTIDVPELTVGCDGRQLERVLTKLLDNAVRHTPDGTAVRISTEEHDGTIVVHVDDEGPGVPEELQDELLRPFVHGPQAATAASPGIGLGLTLARGLVEINRGQFELCAAPGGGTRVSVTLQRA